MKEQNIRSKAKDKQRIINLHFLYLKHFAIN